MATRMTIVKQTDAQVKQWPVTGIIQLSPVRAGFILFPRQVILSLNPWFADYTNLANLELSITYANLPPITSLAYDFDEWFPASDGTFGGGSCFLEQGAPSAAFCLEGPFGAVIQNLDNPVPPSFPKVTQATTTFTIENTDWESWTGDPGSNLEGTSFRCADPTVMIGFPIYLNVYNNDVPGGGGNDGPFMGGDARNVVTITTFYEEIRI